MVFLHSPLFSIVVALSDFLFYGGATECGAFMIWVTDLRLMMLLMSILGILGTFIDHHNTQHRYIYRTLLFMSIIWFALILVLLIQCAIKANVDPTMGGSFGNIANDDRYRCVYGSFATPGDRPPFYRSWLDLTGFCVMPVTRDDLRWNNDFIFNFLGVLFSILTFIVLLNLEPRYTTRTPGKGEERVI